MIHILTWRNVDIACAQRFQRLCMEMAQFPARVQKQMTITTGRPAAWMEELK